MTEAAAKPTCYDQLFESVRSDWDAHDKTCTSLPHLWLGRKGYSVRRGLDFKELNWKVNQHMGVAKRPQATISQLSEGIDLVARWERES